MAKKPSYVWGIDIGQCALKALRCTWQDGQLVADAFDYIEYPKILSQPEADPIQLVNEAIEQFLSRNEVKGDKVAISVPGQSGLAKFFKPPPVDVKRIPNIVQYEAKQQIPFPLEEVIWDFQQLAGGQVVDGFAIDTEVGLFAMKREQVYRFLKPFDVAEIEVDIIQLAPLSVYNFVSHDVLTDGPDPEMFDPDDPPESIVVLSMGTDATDLVITNGFRVWQRSIPLGGNHFTKQLTKELKLTFAKAEHLKRNARQAEDPKAVFQAMRPIFNDVVNEVQRSVGFFQSIDRKAKIRGVILLGNTVKLPGLQQYVAKNLGYEVIEFENFGRLSGSTVTTAPAFTDNSLSFGVCYGLCLQALKQSRLNTNLLPREIATRRLIRAKKPWAVATVSALLMACAFNFVFVYSVWSEVQPDYQRNNVAWESAERAMASRATESSGHEQTHADKVARLEFVERVGEEVVGAGDRRLLWLELMKAINSALPKTPGMTPGVYVSYKDKPLDERMELYIEYVESEYYPDLATWWANPRVQEKYYNLQEFLAARREDAGEAMPPETATPATPMEIDAGAPPVAPGATDLLAPAGDPLAAADPIVDGAVQIEGPSGPGWVIEVTGYHYYNKSRSAGGAVHVRSTFLKELKDGSVVLPVTSDGSQMREFTMNDLGIQFPILAIDSGQPTPAKVPNPEFEGRDATGAMGSPSYGSTDYPGAMAGGMGYPGMSGPGMAAPGLGAPGMGPSGRPGATVAADGADGEDAEVEDVQPPVFDVLKHSFTVQFCWQEKRLTERLQEIAEREKAAAEQAALDAAAAEANPPAMGTDPGVPGGNSSDGAAVNGAPPGAAAPNEVPGGPVPANPGNGAAVPPPPGNVPAAGFPPGN